MKISAFKTDESLEKDGVWVDVGKGLEILVRRFGNKEYTNFLRRIGKPYARQARAGTVDLDVIEKLTVRAMAKHVLVGWRNLQDDDGNDIEYSEQKALELMTEYPDFAQIVQDVASEFELFRQDDQEDAEGNSPGVSGGSSTGDST